MSESCADLYYRRQIYLTETYKVIFMKCNINKAYQLGIFNILIVIYNKYSEE